jgi:starch phosphorylase
MAAEKSNSFRKKQISIRSIPQLDDVAAVKTSFNRHLHQTVVKDRHVATMRDFYITASHTVRDQLVTKWMRTQQKYYDADPKRVYYISMEFLIGRSLTNAMVNLGIDGNCEEALFEVNVYTLHCLLFHLDNL